MSNIVRNYFRKPSVTERRALREARSYLPHTPWHAPR